MFNIRSFANFLKLRNSDHAQIEIREIAREMLKLVDDELKQALLQTEIAKLGFERADEVIAEEVIKLFKK
jgi:thymidylate synthase ThyX